MTGSDSVTVTTVVAVDPTTAFSIFTEEIAAWWKPKVRNLFRKDRVGTMKFEGGRLVEVYADLPDQPFVVGSVLEWTPGQRLVFEWRQGDFAPDQVTRVEVRFESFGGGTRVTLQHSGWDALPVDLPARHGNSGEAFTSMIGLRWADLLTAFRARSSR